MYIDAEIFVEHYSKHQMRLLCASSPIRLPANKDWPIRYPLKIEPDMYATNMM